MAAPVPFETHEVFNQSPVFEDVNLFASDRVLVEAVKREGAGWAAADLDALGARAGSAEMLEQGRIANEFRPRLKTHDTRGRRIDLVEFHPAYHAMMEMSMQAGLHCASWENLTDDGVPKPGVTVARAAGIYMVCQTEPGHFCPITMTHAVVPALLVQPDLAEQWLPKIVSRSYDPAFKPAGQKRSVTFGMGMTEKQGGSDVRANSSTARPLNGGGPGAEYEIVGHKWFFSAPMCDAFLVLAQAPKGISCFLVPRFLPDGELNALHLQRLKLKIGNHANASSEVEFHGASGWLIGEEGRGVRNIIEMAIYTRFDCALSSAGLMRMALARALHHARHRTVFQRKLIDQPLMNRVLADLAVESEAATALTMRLARAYDESRPGRGGVLEQAWKRIMTSAVKYWVCKAGPGFVFEAIECIGGNAYIEENGLGIIYREMPLNSIWEGSGNMMCLDVLRALAREGEAFEALFADFEAVARDSRALSGAVSEFKGILAEPATLERHARHAVELLVRIAAASELLRAGNEAVADAYCATRLDGGRSTSYGAHDAEIDERAILQRAMPASA